jgi:hypothetical protein
VVRHVGTQDMAVSKDEQRQREGGRMKVSSGDQAKRVVFTFRFEQPQEIRQKCPCS